MFTVITSLALVAPAAGALSATSPDQTPMHKSPLVLVSWTHMTNPWWPNLESFLPIVVNNGSVTGGAIILCSVTTTDTTYYGGTAISLAPGQSWTGSFYVEVPDGSVFVSAGCTLIPLQKNPTPGGISEKGTHLDVTSMSYGMDPYESVFEAFTVTVGNNGNSARSAVVMCSVTTIINTWYGGKLITLSPGQTLTESYYVTIPTSNVNPLLSHQCNLISPRGLASF